MLPSLAIEENNIGLALSLYFYRPSKSKQSLKWCRGVSAGPGQKRMDLISDNGMIRSLTFPYHKNIPA